MPWYNKKEQIRNVEIALSDSIERVSRLLGDRAIQWTGENVSDVLNFSPHGEIIYGTDSDAQALQEAHDEPAMAIFIAGTPKRKVEIGEWIIVILTEDDWIDTYYTCSNELFESSHEMSPVEIREAATALGAALKVHGTL